MVVQKLLLQEGLRQTKKYSVSVLGYDFVGLVSRLAFFYLVGFLINSYMIASIKGGIWLNTIATLFGASLPQTLPQWLTDLFTVGLGSKGFPVSETPLGAGKFNPQGWNEKFQAGGEFEGMEYFDYGTIEHRQATGTTSKIFGESGITITFWQIVQIISILLIVLEYSQYDRKLKEEGTKANVTTMAVFAMLGIGISLITFPQMITKFKEMRILNGAA